MKKRKPYKNVRMYKGLPLVDATKGMEVCITKRDVSISRKKDPSNCAAANAIKRSLKTDAEVHISRTYIKANDKWIRFVTPQSISREITAFDRNASFEPGTYHLQPPSPGQRLDYHIATGKKTGSGTKKRSYHSTVNIRERAE